MISLKEALKAQVAAYKKAMEDAVKVVAAAVAAEEDTLAELDSGNKKDSDDDAYAEDIKDIKAIEVEDKGDSILD